MPATPFDPDELRRQRLLAGVMDPDEEDLSQQTGMDPSAYQGGPQPIASPSAQLTPAQSQYRSALQDMPKPEDYHPSRLRSILGIAAGVGTGALTLNPDRAMAVARNVQMHPYDIALQNWQRGVEGALKPNVELEGEVQKQDIARQRAGAYNRTADARQRAAQATEEWRRYQEEHQLTFPQQLQLKQAGVRPPAVGRPTGFEEYQSNPVDYAKYIQLRSKPPNSLTLNERKQLTEYTAQMRAKYRAPQRDLKAPSPVDQARAEDLAMEQLLRNNPEYKAFTVTEGTGKLARTRIKTIDELPKASGVRGAIGSVFGNNAGGITPAQESLARDQYRKFLTEVEKQKKNILNSSAGQSNWEIQDDDNDASNEDDNDQDDK